MLKTDQRVKQLLRSSCQAPVWTDRQTDSVSASLLPGARLKNLSMIQGTVISSPELVRAEGCLLGRNIKRSSCEDFNELTFQSRSLTPSKPEKLQVSSPFLSLSPCLNRFFNNGEGERHYPRACFGKAQATCLPFTAGQKLLTNLKFT